MYCKKKIRIIKTIKEINKNKQKRYLLEKKINDFLKD